jgi:type II secretory pathway pseudopilin PulG
MKMTKLGEKGRSESRRRRHRQNGFTLVETLFGLTMLTILGAGSFWIMNVMNVYATGARLYTEATAKAEQQIDAILTAGPFDPAANPQKIPTVLTPGTTNQDGVLIYKDPVTNQTVVTGRMTTTVSDTGLTGTVGATATNLNIWKATVTVKYNFRNPDPAHIPYNYSVSLDTMRTGDQ